MAAIYSVSPIAGVALPGTASSTLEFKPGTQVFGSDGFVWMYVKAKSALGSADLLLVAAGQNSAAATANAYPSADGVASAALANFQAQTKAGAIAANKFFWARAQQVGAIT